MLEEEKGQHLVKEALFLDIDGVIAPYFFDGETVEDRIESSNGSFFSLLPMIGIYKSVASWLSGLDPQNTFWSSSWCSMSNDINDSLGIDRFQELDYPSTLSSGWKKDFVEKKVQELHELHPELETVIVADDDPYFIETPKGVSAKYVIVMRNKGIYVDPRRSGGDAIESEMVSDEFKIDGDGFLEPGTFEIKECTHDEEVKKYISVDGCGCFPAMSSKLGSYRGVKMITVGDVIDSSSRIFHFLYDTPGVEVGLYDIDGEKCIVTRIRFNSVGYPCIAVEESA